MHKYNPSNLNILRESMDAGAWPDRYSDLIIPHGIQTRDRFVNFDATNSDWETPPYLKAFLRPADVFAIAQRFPRFNVKSRADTVLAFSRIARAQAVTNPIIWRGMDLRIILADVLCDLHVLLIKPFLNTPINAQEMPGDKNGPDALEVRAIYAFEDIIGSFNSSLPVSPTPILSPSDPIPRLKVIFPRDWVGRTPSKKPKLDLAAIRGNQSFHSKKIDALLV